MSTTSRIATTASQTGSTTSRTLGVLEFLFGLFVFFAGLAAATLPPTRLFSYAVAVVLFGLTGYLLYDALFVRLTGPQPSRSRARRPTRRSRPRSTAPEPQAHSVGDAWRRHRDELEEQPDSARRPAVAAIWDETLRRGAPGYAQRVAEHAQRKQLAAAEQGTVLTAYRCGYLAGRGWLDPRLVQRQMPRLGRALRDEVRRLGLDSSGMSPATGVVIDEALRRISEQGEGDGRRAGALSANNDGARD